MGVFPGGSVLGLRASTARGLGLISDGRIKILQGNAKECTNYCTVALISHASNAQNFPSQASAIHEP